MMEISQPTMKCVETSEDRSYGKYVIIFNRCGSYINQG